MRFDEGPAGDSKAKPDLRISARILREGDVVLEREFAASAVEPVGTSAHLVARGIVPLDRSLPAGEYVLELRVQNGTGESKNSAASQFIDFQVIAR